MLVCGLWRGIEGEGVLGGFSAWLLMELLELEGDD